MASEPAETVLPTILMAFSLHTLVIALAFGALAILRLDRVMSKCPKQVLLGAMGGIGSFLLITATGQARRSGADSCIFGGLIAAGLIPALTTIAVRRGGSRLGDSPFLVPTALLCLAATFYTLVLVLRRWSLSDLRQLGWIIIGLPVNIHISPLRIYSFWHPSQVEWSAIGACIPTMLASAAFAMLQLPINVPSFGRSTGQRFSLRQEFGANAALNLATSMAGLQPSYFMYTPSLLMVQAGAGSKACGYGLALSTAAALFFGLGVLAFIPVPAVLFLLYYLGSELVLEALWDSRKLADPFEYGTVLVMIGVMSAFGFIQGLLLGLTLAFASTCYGLYNHIGALDTLIAPVDCTNMTRYGASEDAFLETVKGQELVALRLPAYYHFGNSSRTIELIRSSMTAQTRLLLLDLGHAGHIGLGLLEGLQELTKDCLGDSNCPVEAILLVTGPQHEAKLRRIGFHSSLRFCPDLMDALLWVDRVMLLELESDFPRISALEQATSRSWISLDETSGLLLNEPHGMSFAQAHRRTLMEARFRAANAKICIDTAGPNRLILPVPAGTVLWRPGERLEAIYQIQPSAEGSPVSAAFEEFDQVGQRVCRYARQALIGYDYATADRLTLTACVALVDCQLLVMTIANMPSQ